MWVANAATVSPSGDTEDGRVHFTPANLASNFHRSLEAPTTTRVLRAIFSDPAEIRGARAAAGRAAVRRRGRGEPDALRGRRDRQLGIELFVYGRARLDTTADGARRAFRRGRLAKPPRPSPGVTGSMPRRVLFVQQDPAAIDAGAFHNDVVAVANGSVLFCHERAFLSPEATLASLRSSVGAAFTPIVVREREVSLERAIATYVFNSQLITRADGNMLLVAPAECIEDEAVAAYLQGLIAGEGPIRELRVFDLRQSMRNGGGPACLRLRVPLSDAERAAIGANVWLDDALHAALVEWVKRHYRDRLSPDDLADPALLDEGRRALDELSRLLRIGSCVSVPARLRYGPARVRDASRPSVECTMQRALVASAPPPL